MRSGRQDLNPIPPAVSDPAQREKLNALAERGSRHAQSARRDLR